jgi:hypothetical protein
MIVQTVTWQHTRQNVTAIADRTSLAVAAYEIPAGEAQADAQASLTSSGVRNVVVSVERGEQLTVVVITGRVPGILAGTSIRVSARSVSPTVVYGGAP